MADSDKNLERIMGLFTANEPFDSGQHSLYRAAESLLPKQIKAMSLLEKIYSFIRASNDPEIPYALEDHGMPDQLYLLIQNCMSDDKRLASVARHILKTDWNLDYDILLHDANKKEEPKPETQKIFEFDQKDLYDGVNRYLHTPLEELAKIDRSGFLDFLKTKDERVLELLEKVKPVGIEKKADDAPPLFELMELWDYGFNVLDKIVPFSGQIYEMMKIAEGNRILMGQYPQEIINKLRNAMVPPGAHEFDFMDIKREINKLTSQNNSGQPARQTGTLHVIGVTSYLNPESLTKTAPLPARGVITGEPNAQELIKMAYTGNFPAILKLAALGMADDAHNLPYFFATVPLSYAAKGIEDQKIEGKKMSHIMSRIAGNYTSSFNAYLSIDKTLGQENAGKIFNALDNMLSAIDINVLECLDSLGTFPVEGFFFPRYFEMSYEPANSDAPVKTLGQLVSYNLRHATQEQKKEFISGAYKLSQEVAMVHGQAIL